MEDKYSNYDPKKLFQYRNYIDILPAFIKAVDFTDYKEVAICYNYLDKSEKTHNIKPEEALALLDSQFGDEHIRLFAVQKISTLDDYLISLYMPQLIQSIKYEPFHASPLSEFLLERAIKNTGVVGHALFWSLTASLHSKSSFERLYLILERFLMCCGRFKFQLYIQTQVNRTLQSVC